MAKRIAGVAYWKVNGRQLALRGNFTISPSAFERAGIAGQDYVHGFSEVPRVPFISGDVSLVEGTSVEDIDAMVDETVRPNWPTATSGSCATPGARSSRRSIPARASSRFASKANPAPRSEVIRVG